MHFMIDEQMLSDSPSSDESGATAVENHSIDVPQIIVEGSGED